MNFPFGEATCCFVAALALGATAASCGGKIVSSEEDTENAVGKVDASPPEESNPPPPLNDPDTGTPPTDSLDGVAANCDPANVVYVDVVDATGTQLRDGTQLFPARSASSTALNMSPVFVEVTTFGTTDVYGITVSVGGQGGNAEPLAITTYAEPPDDSGGAPFLGLVIDQENVTQEGVASGSFAITALASGVANAIEQPFAVAFDIRVATSLGTARFVGCAHWTD